MQAGKLRHRLALQSAATTRNSYGEKEKAWSTYDTVWGSVEPMQGNERVLAQQVNAKLSHKIRIRYNSSVTVQHRILFDSRYFHINAIILPEEREAEMELMCSEAVE